MESIYILARHGTEYKDTNQLAAFSLCGTTSRQTPIRRYQTISNRLFSQMKDQGRHHKVYGKDFPGATSSKLTAYLPSLPAFSLFPGIAI